MKIVRKKAKELHESVNHKYAGRGYIVHLDLVYSAYQAFRDEAPKVHIDESIQELIYEEAAYFHDSIEDCRVTPNDLLNKYNLTAHATFIVFALTNEKGWSREDRANKKYYSEMRKIPGATFVKMCDRIANVSFSKATGSSMFEKYKAENKKFMKSVQAKDFPKMRKYLKQLLNG